MKTGDSPSLFASYKSDDVALVRAVCEGLLGSGYSTWFNEYDVPHDRIDEFQRFINRGIDEASFGLLFSNDRYARSPYCNIEVERLLRRLPPDRLFVFQTTAHSIFQDDYPELEPRRTHAAHPQDVFTRLHEAGVIDAVSPAPTFPAPTADAGWWLKEIGARFNSFPWHPDPDAIWPQWDVLDVTGEPRSDPNAFLAEVGGRSVALTVDYRFLETDLATSFAQRTSASPEGELRFRDDEQDDRQRLRDELLYFSREVATVRKVAGRGRTRPTPADDLPAFESIGVHMLDTVESLDGVRNTYKHRLFSYRLGGRIYRVYKLALPQPQLRRAVAIRFVFRFEDDIRSFFRTLPLCDAVVKSFTWVTLSTTPRLRLEDVRQAARRARGDAS